METSNKDIENALKDLLDECLASQNQDGSIIKLKYNKDNQTCEVSLTVTIVEEDNYIGFQGY